MHLYSRVVESPTSGSSTSDHLNEVLSQVRPDLNAAYSHLSRAASFVLLLLELRGPREEKSLNTREHWET